MVTHQGHAKLGRAYSLPSDTGVKSAPYKLNQKKQLGKLQQDSLLNDFTITVSPTEQSVSIICSTGFYTLVAVPAFSSSSVGSSHHVAGITMHCYDVTGKIDDVGANVNAVIFYRFTRPDKTVAGGVTIHLHHTARRVQIQGSTMVTSQCRSSVWFVQNYLLGKFTEESQKKALDITRFNAAVNSLVTNHVDKINAMEKCEECSGHFNGRSIREQCRKCSKTFHEKCIQQPSHTCMLPNAMAIFSTLGGAPAARAPQPRPGLAPLVRPELAHMSQAVPGPGQVLIPQPRPEDNPLSRLTIVNPPTVYRTSSRELSSLASSDTAPAPAPAPHMPVVGQAFHTDLSAATNTEITLNPTAAHFLPSAPSLDMLASDVSMTDVSPPTLAATPSIPTMTSRKSSGTGHQSIPKVKNGKKSLKNTPAIDKTSFEVECLRKQLNIASTKIQELESDLEKKRNTNYILGERIKLFEAANNKDIFEKYFPSEPRKELPAAHSPPCCSCNHYHCCAQRPPPPCTSSMSHAPYKDDGLMNVVKELSSKLTQLSNETAELKVKVRELVGCKSDKADKMTMQAGPPHTPLSPDIIVLEQGQFSPGLLQNDQQHDQSASSDSNTIDDNVPSDEQRTPLNFNVPTIQLNQLRHTQAGSVQ